MAWNLGETLASTLPAYEKEFKDQVFAKTVLLDHMKSNGGIVQKGGGATLRIPLMTGKSTTQWFAGADEIDISLADTLDAAEYSWKNLDAPISFTLDDELSNSGPEQVVDLIEAKVKQAELSIAEQLNDALFNGTGSEAPRSKITGLATAVGTGTYAGIAGGTYTDWQSYVESTSTALTIAQMKTARNTVSKVKGGGKPSIIVTTQTLFEKYESLLTPTYYMNPAVETKETKRIGDAGFSFLQFAGIPIVFDDACPSGSVFFLNTENLKMYVHKDAFMDKTDRMKPVNQHVTTQHIILRTILGTNLRKALGKLSGKTA